MGQSRFVGLFLILLVCSNAWAGQNVNPETGRLDLCLTFEETDGSPSNTTCGNVSVANGTLTDDGDGTYTFGVTASNSFETISVPAGTTPVADSTTDTLTITETTFLTLTGTAGTDTIDITQVTTDLGTDGLIAVNAVELTTDTTGNYAAGDAEAGAALTGDSATSFFSTGILEVGIGGTGATTLTDGGILLGSGTGAITPLGVAANGQVPIGDGTTDPVLATVTGTADEITVTNGAGSITLDMPDPLIASKGGTGAASLTDGGILLGSGTGAVTALGVATNGQIPIGDGTTDPVLATVTGTANEITVTNGAGSITIDLPDSVVLTTSLTVGSTEPADAGAIRLNNADTISWEASPASTDVTLTVTASEVLQASGALNAVGAITGSNLSGTNTGDQTITLTGDVTGSGTGSFAATIAANAVALTTDTTGNYVVEAVDGSGIDVTGTADEGWSATINLLYTDTLAGNPTMNAEETRFSTDGTGGGLLFEGATADAIEGLLVWSPTTSDRTLTLPDATDTLVGLQTTDTLKNKSISATENVVTADDLICTNCIGPTEISDLTLTTDTAGNYVANVGEGAGIDVTGTAGEGWTPTVAFDSTEIAGTTWGSGSAFRWTADAGVTDSTIDFNSGLTVFNELAADTNVRMEGIGDINLFFLDAGTNRVAIGSDGSLTSKFTVVGTDNEVTYRLRATAGQTVASMLFEDSLGNDLHVFGPTGGTVFNETGNSVDFRVESNLLANALFVQGSTDRVGINDSTPDNLLDIIGADNTTVGNIEIPVVQASVTASDCFLSFSSTTGVEGSICGTASAGVIAYNTFTGSHYTQIVDRSGLQPLMLLEAIDEPMEALPKQVITRKQLDAEGVDSEVSDEYQASPKPHLFKSRICRTKGSKAVIGVYGGTNNEGNDTILAIGTGQMIVANKGANIELGDYLQSSDVPGAAEKQPDDLYRNSTAAKITQSVRWLPGETTRIVNVIYEGG